MPLYLCPTEQSDPCVRVSNVHHQPKITRVFAAAFAALASFGAYGTGLIRPFILRFNAKTLEQKKPGKAGFSYKGAEVKTGGN